MRQAIAAEEKYNAVSRELVDTKQQLRLTEQQRADAEASLKKTQDINRQLKEEILRQQEEQTKL